MSNLINLTNAERLILANQYEILSKLSEDKYERQSYEKMSSNLKNGYKWLYEQYFDVVSENLSADASELVIKTLCLYQALHYSYEDLDDKDGISEHEVKFQGFDGNNETELMGFVRALKENDRFIDTIENGHLNSHRPMVNTYKKMVQQWQGFDEEVELTKDQIQQILNK